MGRTIPQNVCCVKVRSVGLNRAYALVERSYIFPLNEFEAEWDRQAHLQRPNGGPSGPALT